MKFEWDDHYEQSRPFGGQLMGTVHNNTRPVRVVVDVSEMGAFNHVPELVEYLHKLANVGDSGIIIVRGM